MDSRNERERLKEEYKAHYRKMREDRERLNRAKKTQNITQALKSMDKSQMLESFDDFLHSVKRRLVSVEARLDVAMDSLLEGQEETVREQELDEEMSKENARDTLRQVKMEMGLLYKEIERQAGSINVSKTIGSGSSETVSEDQTGEESSEN
ncbi:MAG TPA: hypothetical protein VF181_07875 [Balneolaceae bacterium]